MINAHAHTPESIVNYITLPFNLFDPIKYDNIFNYLF